MEENMGKYMETLDLMSEKHLTPAELKKREEIAKAMERENPDMPMGRKMAIATATAKKVAEEVEDLDEAVKLGTKVKIHAPGKDYHQKVGYVGEIRHGLYKGAPKTYTVDYDNNQSIQLDKKNIKAIKEAKEGSVPRTEREKDLADEAEPRDRITKKDVLIKRGVLAKEEMEQMTPEHIQSKMKYHANEFMKAVKAGDHPTASAHSMKFVDYEKKLRKMQNESVDLDESADINKESKLTYKDFIAKLN